MQDKTIGQRIREERKRQGLTMAQLGEKMGISGSLVGRYERGEENPKMETVVRFADALGILVSGLYSDPEEAHDVEQRLINSSSESFQARLLRAIEDLGVEIDYEEYVLSENFGEHLRVEAKNKLRDEFLPRIAKFYDIPEEVLKENFGEFQECHDFDMEEMADFSEAGQQAILILEALNEAGQAAALRHLQELAQIPAYQATPQPAGENQAETSAQAPAGDGQSGEK